MIPTVFEQSDVIGGTWVYSDNIEDGPLDEELVHSSMYEGLRTNLPKEVMGFPDFLYPDTIEESFVSSSEVLKFLNAYADHFDLKKHIKFRHYILRVRPRNDQWEVMVVNLENETDEVVLFDYVFVCNGHYSAPIYPTIAGVDSFRGRALHSHYYRKPYSFKDEVVLVIGAGASGVDITHHIHKYAKRVLLSHHMDPAPDTEFMNNVTQKPDVAHFTETAAVFKDGSTEEISSVIFCTGYETTFPFLDADCGLHVKDNYVQPLYKHCININQPTMTVIGLPFLVCPTQLFDLQVRFALKFYSGQKELPSKEEMLADTEKDMEERWAKGFTKRQAHMMGKQEQFDHYRDLCQTAGIKNIKPVIENIIKDCGQKYIFELGTYRSNCFRVIDDENFVKYTLNK